MADLQQSIARLQAACDNPRAQLDYYLSQGKKDVSCFAPWAPEEHDPHGYVGRPYRAEDG